MNQKQLVLKWILSFKPPNGIICQFEIVIKLHCEISNDKRIYIMFINILGTILVIAFRRDNQASMFQKQFIEPDR